MLLTFLNLLDHVSLQSFITLTHNPLKHTIIQRPIKTAAIPPRLPILIINSHQTLHLNIKPLIIHKLIHQQSQWKQITNQWRLRLNLLTYHCLLLLMHLHLQLLLELVLGFLLC